MTHVERSQIARVGALNSGRRKGIWGKVHLTKDMTHPNYGIVLTARAEETKK